MKVRGLVPNFDNPASVTGALQNPLGGAKNSSQVTPSPGDEQPLQQNPPDCRLGSLVVRAQVFSGDWLAIEKDRLYRVIG